MAVVHKEYYTKGSIEPQANTDVIFTPEHNPEFHWLLTLRQFEELFHKTDEGYAAVVIARKSSDGTEMVIFNRHLISVMALPNEEFNNIFRETYP